MRFRLRTLMIVLAIGPMMFAALWFFFLACQQSPLLQLLALIATAVIGLPVTVCITAVLLSYVVIRVAKQK